MIRNTVSLSEEGMADKNATAKDPTDEPSKVQTRTPDLHDEESLNSFNLKATATRDLEIAPAKDMSSDGNTASQHQGTDARKAVRKKAPAKYEKAPEAPKRFKSAFILFSADKHKQIRAQMGEYAHKQRTAAISKLVAEAWRELPQEEVETWETLARNDRNRYELEKAQYNGPWHVLKTRKRKDASAPKRPMSAFLAFANSRRAEVKRNMPNASNGDTSRALAVMWREAPAEVRQRYIDEELQKREEYLAAVADWKKHREEEKRLEKLQTEQTEKGKSGHEALNPALNSSALYFRSERSPTQAYDGANPDWSSYPSSSRTHPYCETQSFHHTDAQQSLFSYFDPYGMHTTTNGASFGFSAVPFAITHAQPTSPVTYRYGEDSLPRYKASQELAERFHTPAAYHFGPDPHFFSNNSHPNNSPNGYSHQPYQGIGHSAGSHVTEEITPLNGSDSQGMVSSEFEFPMHSSFDESLG